MKQQWLHLVMWLDEEQVSALTNCRHRRRHVRHRLQVEALRFMGVQHKQRPDGSVAILCAHVEHLFGGKPSAKLIAPPEPDWSTLNAT
jgi:hypothetical protein